MAALNYQRKASPGLFQIALADAMFTSGGVTERLADLLYANVLREPRPRDWQLDPLEVIAIQSTPHALPMEHWFELALAAQGTGKGARNRRSDSPASAACDPAARRPLAGAALGAAGAEGTAR